MSDAGPFYIFHRHVPLAQHAFDLACGFGGYGPVLFAFHNEYRTLDAIENLPHAETAKGADVGERDGGYAAARVGHHFFGPRRFGLRTRPGPERDLAPAARIRPRHSRLSRVVPQYPPLLHAGACRCQHPPPSRASLRWRFRHDAPAQRTADRQPHLNLWLSEAR